MLEKEVFFVHLVFLLSAVKRNYERFCVDGEQGGRE